MQYVAGGTLQGVIEHARGMAPTMRSGRTLIEAIDVALVGATVKSPPEWALDDSLSAGKYELARSRVLARRATGRRSTAYAHTRGVLHRDVKLGECAGGGEGHPKLADFNISFSKIDGTTPAAYFGGSLAYMSPEQLEACDPAHGRQPEETDGRSDVYSLGVMLWGVADVAAAFRRKRACLTLGVRPWAR